MAAVTFAHVGKRYKDGTANAVDDLNLEVADGEFMVLVGPSGCGKSTALRMVAGLEEITDGTLSIGARVVNDVPPGDRDIAMVFQNYALYPHMTVRQNIGFALETAKVAKTEIKRRTEEAATLLGLTEYLERLPKALSGGQRQRVAMGRAIVRSPQVFLMDEPLSNLDAKLRVQMRSEIIDLQSRLGTTMVYVTHDQVEAMTMGDRVAVMRNGVLQQVAPPQELYRHPANIFVAAFIGSPAMNLLRSVVSIEGDDVVLSFAEHRLVVARSDDRLRAALVDRAGRPIIAGIRPEHLAMAEDATDPTSVIEVTATLAEAMGAEVHVHALVGTVPVSVEGTGADDEQSGADSTRLIARVDGSHTVSRGDVVRLAVRIGSMHFFDPETGTPLRS